MTLAGNYIRHLIVMTFKLSTLGNPLINYLQLLFYYIYFFKQFHWYLSTLASTIQILANKVTEINDKTGRIYFEGSLKFQDKLTRVLNMLTNRISLMGQRDLYKANVSQMWGIVLLLFVMFLSPTLIVLAKNSISSIHLLAGMAKNEVES